MYLVFGHGFKILSGENKVRVHRYAGGVIMVFVPTILLEESKDV